MKKKNEIYLLIVCNGINGDDYLIKV